MLKKYGYIGLVFLPVVILLAWVTTLEVQLWQGREVVVRVRGYDPRDLLSGHYISYTLDWENTDCSQFDDEICPVNDFDQVGRFYVDEDKAVALDKEVRDRNNTAEIVFSYRKGKKPLALNLLVNGKNYEKAADKN